MRILFLALLLHSTLALAEQGELARPVGPGPASTHTSIVAQTQWPNAHKITLLTESCGWPGGAMRAQWIQQGHRIQWGCWGYNETGVQIQWSSGPQMWVDFLDLFHWNQGLSQQLGYQTLHQRVLFLRNIR